MNSDAERELEICNSLKQIHSAGGKYKKEIAVYKPPLDLLLDIMRKLELRRKHFEVE